MVSFQDTPDENIEHDEKMELRSREVNFYYQQFVLFLSLGIIARILNDLDWIYFQLSETISYFIGRSYF